MDISTDDLQAFLNLAWQSATSESNSLSVELLKQQQQSIAFLASGSISSVSKNSTSQGYSYYGPGTLTHRQIVSIWTKLIELYDTVKAKVDDAFSDASITVPDGFDYDTPVYDQMISLLRVSGRTPTTPDIRDIRVPLSRTTTTEVICN